MMCVADPSYDAIPTLQTWVSDFPTEQQDDRVVFGIEDISLFFQRRWAQHGLPPALLSQELLLPCSYALQLCTTDSTATELIGHFDSACLEVRNSILVVKANRVAIDNGLQG